MATKARTTAMRTAVVSFKALEALAQGEHSPWRRKNP
jgi:hypothetical protein